MSYPSPIATMKAYLDACAVAASDPARAYGGVPNPRPTRFWRLLRAGATTLSVAHRDVRIVVECWESDEARAETFGDWTHGLLSALNLSGGHVPQGAGGWLGGPYSQPDPDSGTPRSVMTVILRQRSQP